MADETQPTETTETATQSPDQETYVSRLEIEALLHSDPDKYHNYVDWTGKTPAQKLYDILKFEEPDVATYEPSDREAEIVGIMEEDIARYNSEGLSDELSALREGDQAIANMDVDLMEAMQESLRRDFAPQPEEEPREEDSGEEPEKPELDASDDEDTDTDTGDGEASSDVDLDTVPDDPSEYGYADGVELSDIDRQIIDEFNGKALDLGLTVKDARAVQSIGFELAEAAREAEATRLDAIDQADYQAARSSLMEEFGGEAQYREQITAVRDFLVDQGPLGEMIARARDETTGHRLMNDPTFALMLARMAQGNSDTSPQATPTQAPARGNLEAEFRELNALLYSDVGAFQAAPWKGSHQTGSERMLELRRILKR